jgi:serine/threonine protein kinase/uncharacterized protein YecT (DUF1311 family)
MASSDVDFPSDLRALESDYELIRELGQGGMAAVYLARQRSTGRLVAIKAIRARYLDDRDALARFAREARTVAELDHPNIVRTEAIEQIGDRAVAIIMEHISGGTVRDRLREFGSLGAEDAEWILRDVANALAYAHRRGIVHRDVKPENIFLDPSRRRALLSDFGIARKIDNDAVITLLGAALGTPQYMSPEQIDGQSVDGRSDIYSLGVLGWELLTGRRPWAGESLYGVIYKQKHEDLPRITSLRPRVPANLLFAIEGALVKDKERRFQTISEFLDQLTYNPPPLLSQTYPAGPPRGDYEPTLRFVREELPGESEVEAPLRPEAAVVSAAAAVESDSLDLAPPQASPLLLPVADDAPTLAPIEMTGEALMVADDRSDYTLPEFDPNAIPSFEFPTRRRRLIQALGLLAPLGIAAASLFVLLGGSSTGNATDRSSFRTSTSAGSTVGDSVVEPRAVPVVPARDSGAPAKVAGVAARNGSVKAPTTRAARKSNQVARTRVSGAITSPAPAAHPVHAESSRAVVAVRPPEDANGSPSAPKSDAEAEAKEPRPPLDDPFRFPSRDKRALGGPGSVPNPRCRLAANADQQACLSSYIALGDAPLNQALETLVGELRRVARTPPGAPDPATVQRVRVEQRAWFSIRDSECPRRPPPGAAPFWAEGQADCFAEMATARTAELRDAVNRLRRN